MSGVVRLGDKDSGHDSFPPRAVISASSNVTANGIGVVRLGDAWEFHTDGHTVHDAICSSGSSSVFVNGLPIVMIGSSLSCGGFCVEGSSNVTAN